MPEHAGVFSLEHVDDDICIKKVLQKSSPAVSLQGISVGSLNEESSALPNSEKKPSEYESVGVFR